MDTIKVIALKEIRTALRSKLFLTITLLFLGLSILSVYIGSTTKNAEMRIYNETVASLTAQGVTQLPLKPEISTLTILSNLTEYIAIVGAILAIILGYNALIDEKETGGLKLILSRPVYRDRLLTGKLAGQAVIIAVILGLAFAFNLILLVAVSGIMPTSVEVLRLLILVLLGFVYMFSFLTISMLLSIRLNNGASVLLISLVFWMTVSFVIPQMAETQMANSTVINSISGVTNQIPQDTTTSRAINFISPTWHLRHIGDELLEVTPGSANLSAASWLGDSAGSALILLIPSLLAGAAGYAIFLRDETLVLE
ncbi:MAG: ABC transporter permease subunit [Anaerolineae bacterium]|nr:ABC transporter permease subunit [Anaerolineae bacterium]